MSDQVFGEPESQDSHAADVNAGFDSGGDEDEVGTSPSGVPRIDVDDDDVDTSHDADVAAAYDESDGE